MKNNEEKIYQEGRFEQGEPQKPHTEESFRAALTEYKEFMDSFFKKHNISVISGLSGPTETKGFSFISTIFATHFSNIFKIMAKLQQDVMEIIRIQGADERNKN